MQHQSGKSSKENPLRYDSNCHESSQMNNIEIKYQAIAIAIAIAIIA
jgi:hypothetical protein